MNERVGWASFLNAGETWRRRGRVSADIHRTPTSGTTSLALPACAGHGPTRRGGVDLSGPKGGTRGVASDGTCLPAAVCRAEQSAPGGTALTSRNRDGGLRLSPAGTGWWNPASPEVLVREPHNRQIYPNWVSSASSPPGAMQRPSGVSHLRRISGSGVGLGVGQVQGVVRGQPEESERLTPELAG